MVAHQNIRLHFTLCGDSSFYTVTVTVNPLICFCFFTCGGSDGLAGQTDAGVMASHHRNAVVLPTRQVREVTVGVSAVTFSVVAEIAPSEHGIRCGTTCCVPCDHSDTSVAVHSCCEVGGNTRRWWRERERSL